MQASRSLLLRPARAADATDLIAILHDTFESTWAPQITASAAGAYRAQNRARAYVSERGHAFWVCERAGEIAGFVDWNGDFVNALHVRGAHAHTGVGACLMEKAESEIAASGFPSARLETDTFNMTSRNFYARRGYLEIALYPDQEWDSDLTTILLVKHLRQNRREGRR